MNSMWSFTFRDSFRCFLKFDMLFIREETGVMDELETISTLAITAEIWF
jgi:hypothetical protein